MTSHDPEGNWRETLGCLVVAAGVIFSVGWVALIVWLIIEAIQWLGRN